MRGRQEALPARGTPSPDRASAPAAPARGDTGAAGSLLALGSAIGNRRLGAALRSGDAGSVSGADDPAEVHARGTAERVLGMAPPAAPLPRPPPLPAAGGGLPGVAGGGRPLGADTRAFFEPRLGVDLGAVRVHTGPGAAASARDAGARAYTVGHHVAFGDGMYQPGTHAGRRLLAHELTHVLQHAGVAGPPPVPGRAYRDPDPRLAQEQRMRDTRQSLESTGQWARGQAHRPGVPSMTGIVGLPQERRDDMARALAGLDASVPSVEAAATAIARVGPLMEPLVAEVADAGRVARQEGAGPARQVLDHASTSTTRVVEMLDAVHAHHDVRDLRDQAAAFRASIQACRTALRPGDEVDTEGLGKLKEAAGKLKKAVGERKLTLDAAPVSLQRMRFVLRYFLAVNDPAFTDAPTAAEEEQVGARLDDVDADLTVLFGTRLAIDDLDLVAALAHRFHAQLRVRTQMGNATGARPGRVPEVASVRAYFASLKKASNEEVIEAYEKYASAFYEHQAVSSTQDLEVQGIDALFTRPVSIGGTRGLVCTGYAILGGGLLELAGGKPKGFVVAVRASDAQIAGGGALSDAHAIARVQREGRILIVSNNSVVADQEHAIGPDAVAWTDKENPMYTGAGATIKAATQAVQKRLAARKP